MSDGSSEKPSEFSPTPGIDRPRVEPSATETVAIDRRGKNSRSEGWLFLIPGIFAGAGLAALAVIFWPGAAAWVGSAPAIPEKTPQTEAVFIQRVSNGGQSSAVLNEWRAARQEHKNVAFAIAACDRFEELDNMPRPVFSRLLLDLSPVGQHEFPPESLVNTGGTAVSPFGQDVRSAGHIQLVGLQPAMLVLSDEVARARLEAARAADHALPGWFGLSWVTIGITALTTLLITLRPMADSTRWAPAIAFLTILFSVSSTTLTSVKSIYDPGQAYSANSQALVKLQNLHRQIALRLATDYPPGGCAPESDGAQVAGIRKIAAGLDLDGSYRDRLEGWAKQLDTIESTITTASVVVPNSSTPQAPPIQQSLPAPQVQPTAQPSAQQTQQRPQVAPGPTVLSNDGSPR